MKRPSTRPDRFVNVPVNPILDIIRRSYLPEIKAMKLLFGKTFNYCGNTPPVCWHSNFVLNLELELGSVLCILMAHMQDVATLSQYTQNCEQDIVGFSEERPPAPS